MCGALNLQTAPSTIESGEFEDRFVYWDPGIKDEPHISFLNAQLDFGGCQVIIVGCPSYSGHYEFTLDIQEIRNFNFMFCPP